MRDNRYPRESIEHVAVKVWVDDEVVTDPSGVQLAVTTLRGRPVTWVNPIMLEDRMGIMTGSYAPGIWKIWARITSSPEVPVVECGLFIVE